MLLLWQISVIDVLAVLFLLILDVTPPNSNDFKSILFDNLLEFSGDFKPKDSIDWFFYLLLDLFSLFFVSVIKLFFALLFFVYPLYDDNGTEENPVPDEWFVS